MGGGRHKNISLSGRELDTLAKRKPTLAQNRHSLCGTSTQGSHAMSQATIIEQQPKTVRAGVFSTVEATDKAVQRLQAAGFTTEQITVICSDETKERHFRQFEHQEKAGSNTPAAVATGGAIGATLGSLATGAVGIAMGGVPLVVAGGIGLMAGAVWGGFIGAMLTRGIEKEAANFYDQSVQDGKLLVTVEDRHPGGKAHLSEAERILAEAGAEPIPLPEG
jgi:phage tail tape-measure protein